MSRIGSHQLLVPSLLDRLIDHEPGNSREAASSSGQLLGNLKLSVRRDLENLLNTRWRCKVWPPDLTELESSLVNYGLPDFTGANLAEMEAREEFRSIIERVIRQYEPRFKSISVQIVKNTESTDRTLRFRIDALLHADPAPEPVAFDTALEPTTACFEVKRADR